MRPPGPPRGGVVDMYDGVLVVALAALPLAALAVWLVARRRGLGFALAEVGIVYGTLPWVWLTLRPGSGASVSLVPLRDLATMSTFQVVGNLMVFAAFGFLAPLRFAALASVPRVVAVAAAGSVLIETAQHVLPIGRVSSVDDVLLNSAGAGLAALAGLACRVSYRQGAVRGEGERRSPRPPATEEAHDDALPVERARTR